jgi:hypothetical protein
MSGSRVGTPLTDRRRQAGRQAGGLNTLEEHRRPSHIKTKHQSEGVPQHGVAMATYTRCKGTLHLLPTLCSVCSAEGGMHWTD